MVFCFHFLCIDSVHMTSDYNLSYLLSQAKRLLNLSSIVNENEEREINKYSFNIRTVKIVCKNTHIASNK